MELVEARVIHPQLIAHRQHAPAHVEHPGIETALAAESHERLPPTRESNTIPARSELNVKRIATVMKGGRKDEIGILRERVLDRRGVVQTSAPQILVLRMIEIRLQDFLRQWKVLEVFALGPGNGPGSQTSPSRPHP